MLEFYKNENQEINTLIKALHNVDKSYMIQNYDRNRDYYQKPERVFVAETYHQLRKLQESVFILEHLSIHVDINKDIRHSQIDSQCIGDDFNRNRLSPDIVFHLSQNDASKENQKLICEFKMSNTRKSLIIKDLKKLIFYKISRLQFQNAVFIFCGNSSEFERKLNGISTEMLQCLIKNKIIVILQKEQNTNNCYNWQPYIFNLQQNTINL